jgi:hypothetical protein
MTFLLKGFATNLKLTTQFFRKLNNKINNNKRKENQDFFDLNELEAINYLFSCCDMDSSAVYEYLRAALPTVVCPGLSGRIIAFFNETNQNIYTLESVSLEAICRNPSTDKEIVRRSIWKMR